MKENPRNIPIKDYDVADMSQRLRDFVGNITGLYNAMLQFDPNGGVIYLGTLHGFNTFYDGAILSVGFLEIDEKAARALRDNVLGENFEGDAFGNPLGTPKRMLVRQRAIIEEMWSVPADFIYWPDHFVNSPDAVFESLDELAKRLHAYRRKAGGFDQMETNENTFGDLQEFKVPEVDARRLRLRYRTSRKGVKIDVVK